MGSRSYKTRGIILRKTKLRESDIIVTLLDDAGEKRQAVAHGARRPGSPLAGRMELYSAVDLVCSQGRNLDVISDSRLASQALRRFGMEQSIAAAPIAELLVHIAQPGLKQERLYDLAEASFDASAHARPATAPVITAAALLKICALSGLRPSFLTCVLCGDDIDPKSFEAPFSVSEGGAVCANCPQPFDASPTDYRILSWAHFLLFSRYAELLGYDADQTAAFAILEVARTWIRTHIGYHVKSLDFVMSCGLFETRKEETDEGI